MTRIADRKTRLVFETGATLRQRGKSREIVVEATPYLATVRLKGTRQRLDVSWESLYFLAAKIEAERKRAERKQRRKGLAA